MVYCSNESKCDRTCCSDANWSSSEDDLSVNGFFECSCIDECFLWNLVSLLSVFVNSSFTSVLCSLLNRIRLTTSRDLFIRKLP